MDSLVGIRFKPTDEEIIRLLKKKRVDPDFSVHTIKEIDIYKFDPWELPGFSAIQSKEEVWYFYCKRYYMCPKKNRSHRKTKSGYWKVTGQGSKMKAKNSRKVIGTKKILPFCSRTAASKNANTKWVMHEIAVEDDPLDKMDFVVCRLERKRVTKRGTSSSDDDQSSQDLASFSNIDIDITEDSFSESALSPPDQPMVYDINHVEENIFLKNDSLISHSRNHVAENICLNAEVLASDNLISYSRNHVAENISLESILPPTQHSVSNRNHVIENTILVSQVPPSDRLISYSRNHVAENTCAESQVLPSHSWVSYLRNQVAGITSAESQLLASQNLASYSRNHVAEIASPELQQLANQNLISYSRNHVAENSSAELHLVPNDNLELLILPNQHSVSYSTNSVEYSFEAEPQLFAEFNPHGGYNGLNNNSFSALQSPIHPEQESSYANGSSYGCGLMNSQFYSDQVNDLINSPRAFQNESSPEEPEQTFTPDFYSSKSGEDFHEATGQTFSPDFNSSKSDGGFYVENSSDTDTEAFTAWVNELFEN